MIARALPTVVKTIIAPYVGRTPDVGSNRKVSRGGTSSPGLTGKTAV